MKCIAGSFEPQLFFRQTRGPGRHSSTSDRCSRGVAIPEVCRKIGVTEQTYYRWRKEYGGLQVDQARRLKELERENARLKRLLADAELDKAILKEAAEGNF